jgi:hypothetical protein
MGYINSNQEKTLVKDIKEALSSLEGWGSVEIYVQDDRVTQITSRKIRKTQHKVADIVS